MWDDVESRFYTKVVKEHGHVVALKGALLVSAANYPFGIPYLTPVAPAIIIASGYRKTISNLRIPVLS